MQSASGFMHCPSTVLVDYIRAVRIQQLTGNIDVNLGEMVWQVIGGYRGVRELLAEAKRMLDQAPQETLGDYPVFGHKVGDAWREFLITFLARYVQVEGLSIVAVNDHFWGAIVGEPSNALALFEPLCCLLDVAGNHFVSFALRPLGLRISPLAPGRSRLPISDWRALSTRVGSMGLPQWGQFIDCCDPHDNERVVSA